MEHAVSADGLYIFHVLALTIYFHERAANLPNSDVNFLRSLTNKLSSLMEGYSKSWRYVLDPYVPCAVAQGAFTYCDKYTRKWSSYYCVTTSTFSSVTTSQPLLHSVLSHNLWIFCQIRDLYKEDSGM